MVVALIEIAGLIESMTSDKKINWSFLNIQFPHVGRALEY